MKIAFDLSSVMWTALLGGEDAEGLKVEFEGRKVLVNSAAHGYERAINLMVAVLHELECAPMDCILVPEGFNSKAPRLAISSGYKVGRERPQESYLEFQKLRDTLCALWRQLGAVVLSQDNVEADDVLAWLAQNTREHLVIVSNDGDLTVLNGKNKHGAKVAVRINGEYGKNKYGDFAFRHITLYKSLVGDSSDKVKGIKGFGPAAWQELLTRFKDRGLDYLSDLVNRRGLLDLEEDAEKDKLVAKLFNGREDWVTSYRLVKLYPEWVNTLENPLRWEPGFTHGQVTDERLSGWAAKRCLVTAENWETFVPWAREQLAKRPWYALDIETSTCDESDDWVEAQGGGVDVMGSHLTGVSLTFGHNMQYTVYISVDHADTKNVDKQVVGEFLASIEQIPVVHNTLFEGPVLFNEFGEKWKDNGYCGFLPNWRDTKLEASYVDENDKLGLKHLSKKWFGYDQVDYATTTTLEGDPWSLPPGGKLLCVVEQEDDDRVLERRQYRMNQLSAAHVFDYAADDTATTAGLHNFFTLFMSLEGTLQVYEQVELAASYLHAQSFVTGVKVSLPKLAELVAEDDKVFDEAKTLVDTYLISQGWEGSVAPVYEEVTAAAIKGAYKIVTGEELKTMVRTPSKVIALFAEQYPTLAGACATVEGLNRMVAHAFKAAPTFNSGSPKQMQKLFYEVMGLPVRVYNKPTDAMRARGERTGTPKTDNLAIAYALKECSEEQAAVLKALQRMKMVETRRGLYYEPYPYFVHWKTGRVHSSHNQCATNTRRASSSKPNLQQLSKHAKVEGFEPRIRELIVPHKKSAVIVSMDFKSQEILLMAEWSKDPGLVSLFVGEKKMDFHAMTGVKVYNLMHNQNLSYDEYVSKLEDENCEEHRAVKKSRALAKAVNFGAQYRIAAKKLSNMLFVSEAEAELMLQAKAEAFPVAEDWSLREMETVKHTGTVTTLLGAVRHLGPALRSEDFGEASKAERQTLSFRIQGSAAEMTKLAEGRMWSERILQKYDCEYISAIHDEVVWSVDTSCLREFILEAHRLMVVPYASMELPVGSSVSFGSSFGEQHELNDDFSVENIDAILETCK